eukprot:SAG11_NODE_373_length_10031_cov_37.400020_3_plen_46_part_00
MLVDSCEDFELTNFPFLMSGTLPCVRSTTLYTGTSYTYWHLVSSL